MNRKKTGALLLTLLAAAVLGLVAVHFRPELTPNAQAAAATAVEPSQAPSEPWIAPDQQEAMKRAKEVPAFVGEVMQECKLCRQQRLRDRGLGRQGPVPTAIICSTAPSSKNWRTDTARCGSCTPSTRPRSRTAPFAIT